MIPRAPFELVRAVESEVAEQLDADRRRREVAGLAALNATDERMLSRELINRQLTALRDGWLRAGGDELGDVEEDELAHHVSHRLWGVVGSAAAFGCRRLPEPPRPERDRSSPGTTRGLIHDHRFLAFSAANLLAACAYAAYETLLPVSATTHHGLDPSHLGLLLAINPAMVVALQLRVTRWSQHVRPTLKLPVASALMGLPFLALSAGRGPVVLAAVIVAFVLGEMLWVPASSAAVIRLAPSERRGGYLGAFNATTPLALVLTPLAAFPLADAAGDGAMWALVAGIGVAGGAAFALLLTGSAGTAHQRRRQSPDHHDGALRPSSRQ